MYQRLQSTDLIFEQQNLMPKLYPKSVIYAYCYSGTFGNTNPDTSKYFFNSDNQEVLSLGIQTTEISFKTQPNFLYLL